MSAPRVTLAVFIVLFLLKVEVLGIHGAGALTVAQLLLAGWLDQRSTDREVDRLPYTQYVGADGVVVREPRGIT